MSTKTNFKRIALVAVAALGMGVLSSAPSQAAVIGVPTIVATNGTATIGTSDSLTAATLQIKFNSTAAADSVVVRTSLGSQPTSGGADTSLIRVGLRDTLTSSGANHTTKMNIAATAAAGFPAEVAAISDQFIISAGAGQVAQKFYYNLDTAVVRVVGTYTIDYFTTVYSAGVAVPASAAFGQLLIVVTDGSLAAADAVTAAGTSTALMYAGSSYGVTNVDSSVSVVNTPSVGTASAVIRVIQKTSAGDPSRESITVTTTVGNVGTTGAALGKSYAFLADADGSTDIGLFADGSSGSAVITVKTTSVTFANKAATFYSSTVATITTTTLASTIGTSSVAAILATAKDASGNTVRSANAVYAYSDAVSVINTGTAPAGSACSTYNSTYGGYLCSFTGANNGTANITIRNASTSTLSTVASTPVAIKVNVAPATSVKLEFNKATYAPGEVAYIIVRPLDAAGAAVGAATMTNLFSSAGITSTAAFGNGSDTTLATVVSPAVANTLATQGYASLTAIALYQVYMPASGGAVTISATGGTGLPSAARVAVTATATVTDSGAAALAAVTALATTVASLKTLITTLTNLVLKIQKKVKA